MATTPLTDTDYQRAIERFDTILPPQRYRYVEKFSELLGRRPIARTPDEKVFLSKWLSWLTCAKCISAGETEGEYMIASEDLRWSARFGGGPNPGSAIALVAHSEGTSWDIVAWETDKRSLNDAWQEFVAWIRYIGEEVAKHLLE